MPDSQEGGNTSRSIESNAVSGNDSGREPILPPFLFRLLHWLAGISVLVLACTGFSLHAVSRPAWSLFDGVLPAFAWGGRINLWHLLAALVFAPSVIAMLWIVRRSRFWRRPTLVILLVGGVLMVVSGLVMSCAPGSFALYTLALSVHTALGLVLIPIAFLWHALCGLTIHWRQLVPTFHPFAKPQGGPVLAFLALAVVTTCLLLNGLPAHPACYDLHVQRVPSAKLTLTELATLPWGDAKPLAIHLSNGSEHEAGQTQVLLRALHDGNEMFIKAVWLDDDENRQYMPWRKVGSKWENLRSGPAGGPMLDECLYYEDKFALAFPIEPDWRFERAGCAVYCHAGGGRAFGYKGTTRPVDVWHWKATRTDSVGQVDDKYWSEVDFSAKDVGRHGDPKESGGYSKNIPKEALHPSFLPDELAAMHDGIIPAGHAVEYTEAAAQKIPEGTIIPGIVASPAVGDRGDICSHSRHEDGRWTVYMRRRLDTGSEHDVKLVPGQTYAFGCAAFDRCSKRHAYNLRSYRLVLQP